MTYLVSEGKWDYCIVLDACRYDVFKEMNQIKGKLSKMISPESDTCNWVSRNWMNGKDFSDIVYVSANPMVSKFMLMKNYRRVPFYHIEEVWDYGWNDSLNTVPPDVVTEAAIKCAKRYPDKRMVVHYIQPHHPYITRPDLDKVGWQPVFAYVKGVSVKYGMNAYQLASLGIIKKEELIEAYRENLKVALEEVEKLIEELDGKIVITADHGEALGEDGIFGHPAGVGIPCLIEVPYLEVVRDGGV